MFYLKNTKKQRSYWQWQEPDQINKDGKAWDGRFWSVMVSIIFLIFCASLAFGA